jgi:hypothetical protein
VAIYHRVGSIITAVTVVLFSRQQSVGYCVNCSPSPTFGRKLVPLQLMLLEYPIKLRQPPIELSRQQFSQLLFPARLAHQFVYISTSCNNRSSSNYLFVKRGVRLQHFFLLVFSYLWNYSFCATQCDNTWLCSISIIATHVSMPCTTFQLDSMNIRYCRFFVVGLTVFWVRHIPTSVSVLALQNILYRFGFSVYQLMNITD